MVYGREISRIIILTIIAAYQPTGYDIMKILREGSGGLVKAGPGTIYPALFILEKKGYIKKIPDRDRKTRYALTEKGREYLREKLPLFRKVIEQTLKLVEKAEKNIGLEA